MLQLAIPNKGALSDGAIHLMTDAGYQCKRSGRELVVRDDENAIDFVFLRPRDITIYVGNGVLDLGITGRDLMLDAEAKVEEIMPLNFGCSSFYYAVPRGSGLTPEKFDGLRIATSYPKIVRQDLATHDLNAEIIQLDGAVEVSVQLGVADVIADVVESGRTLKEAGLEVVGEPLLRSEAILVARSAECAKIPDVNRLLGRIRGILVARSYAMIEYDIHRDKLTAACKITPGIESPTIAPLSNPEWVAVKAMIGRRNSNRIMDELYNLGARGVIVTDIRSCRI